MALRIRDWDRHFENAGSRKLKRLDWVSVPNKTDGEGYMALVNHPDGAAHLGAWYAIVECASRQKVRGNLPPGLPQDDGGICQDIGGICRSLGRISQLPTEVFEQAIPRLLLIGWLEKYECEVQDTRARDHASNCPQLPENTQSPTTLGNSANVLGNSANVLGKKRGHITGQDITGQDRTATATARLLPVELQPQTEYPETLRVIQAHDASADVLFCQRLADTVAREVISHPAAGQWSMQQQAKAVSDRVLARCCEEAYRTPRKKPPGTGLLLTLVPRIAIGGKTNYV